MYERIEQGDIGSFKEHKVEEEFNPERIDKVMLTRHKNAVALAQIERMVLDVVQKIEMAEYLTKESPEYKTLIRQLEIEYKKLDVGHEKTKRYAQFINALKKYIDQDVLAFEQEVELTRLTVEWEIEGSNEEALGQLIFKLLKNQESKNRITAERKEGYFLVSLENDDDYDLVAGEGKEKSGGCYFKDWYLPGIGGVKIIFVRASAVTSKDNIVIVAHERQHFLNDTAFKNFNGTELLQRIEKKGEFYGISGYGENLRSVKDEFLAYIRSGRSADGATNFLESELYNYLISPFTDGNKEELKILMKQIRNELINGLLNLFEGRRELLVYQLIDVPLVKIPEILKKMRKFYSKAKPHFTEHFSNLIPPMLSEEERKFAKHDERFDKLESLYMDIIGLDYWAVDKEENNFNIETLENTVDIEEMKKTEKELKDLKKKYDDLYREIFK